MSLRGAGGAPSGCGGWFNTHMHAAPGRLIPHNQGEQHLQAGPDAGCVSPLLNSVHAVEGPEALPAPLPTHTYTNELHVVRCKETKG
jgi:hypothetical protein